MKIILGISLILNLVLIYLVLKTSEQVINEKPPLEKIIIETHERPISSKKSDIQNPKTELKKSIKSKEETEESNQAPELLAFDNVDLQDAGERLEFDRIEFLSHKLGLSEEIISEHKRLRDAYYKEMESYWKKDPLQSEVNFTQRREMLHLEEKLHQDLEKLFGKEKWERYQKYRHDYNQRSFKQQTEEHRPSIFMGI